ncbi:gephyrin-like molybdotransferase Glp [Tomitella fengzijianii]|uniref:Molybdopterin molybdenumtransferase n=1 Tax=Tomitella fengzijianii TaxID=2597660 RepID=A0A516X5K5_9ACTN|nr:gephyrin-like molybdotransferase Glp [Tomitella fengzijianii]QDQ98336.1 molybdopterin molybdotransferase MoeA [Tomitella fengzijianii]
MRTVAEHRAVVAALLPRSTASAALPLAQAAGRPLAADLVAGRALPAFDNSAMDGYAVRAQDVTSAAEDAPVALPVTADIPAGRTDTPPLEPGTAHRIMTGSPVPVGADAIVPVEDTEPLDEPDPTYAPRADAPPTTARAANAAPHRVAVRRAPAAGRHIRRAGSDVTPGTVVMEAGTTLGAAQLGLLSALGVPQATVVPPCKVLVLSTGSELVEPGRDLLPGQIHESNGIMLAAAAREAGAEAQQSHFVADDADAFLSVLRSADADLVITSGGVSMGAYEVVKDALTERGVEFVRVAMQPGKPQGAGIVDGTPVITLPGNPVSSLVSFEVFVRPALRAAMGFRDTERPRRRAILSESLTAPAGKTQFRRGVFDSDAGTVTTVGPPGSHHLRWMAASDCLLEIAADTTALDAGAEVTVWDLTA